MTDESSRSEGSSLTTVVDVARLPFGDCSREALMVEPFTCGRVTTLRCLLVPRFKPQYRRGHLFPHTEEVVHHGVVEQVFGLMPAVVGGIEPCPANAESMSRSVCDQSLNLVLWVLTGCSVDRRVLRGFLSLCRFRFMNTRLAVVSLDVL